MNTQNTNSSNSPSPRVVVGNVHRQPRPVATTQLLDAEVSAHLNLELLQITTQDLSDEQLRGQLRLLAIKFAGAIGVGHVICDTEGSWDLKPDHVSGRLPRRNEFATTHAERCDEVVTLRTIQIDAMSDVEGCYGLFAPINQFGQAPEVLFVLLNEKTDSRRPIFVAHKLISTFRVCLKNLDSRQQDWKVNSLSAMIDVVSKIENCKTTAEAMELVANELSRHLSVGHVAVGRANRKCVRKLAVSGSAKIDSRTESYHAFQQCLSESILRDEAAAWPAADDNCDQLLLAHRQLASQLNCGAVFSCPLQTVDGQLFGSWLFAGAPENVAATRLQRFVSALSPRIANALRAVERAQHPLWLRIANAVPSQLAKRKTQVALLGFAMLVALMFLPVPYRIRCNCVVEPGARRFAVAPFDGTVLKGFVNAGEEVVEGELLAEMDGRALRYELAEISAEHSIAIKKRAIELADHDIAELQLAEFDGQRLEAGQKLLDYKRDHLQIRSPIAGVVLAGSLERAEASAVRTGDVLFEVGSMDKVHIQIEVPAEDLAQIEVGQSVTVWIQGRESTPLKATLEKIRPQSELRDAKNIFIAEFELESQSDLRPGMQGSARIDGRVHTLGWNLFHKPIDFLRSRFSW